MSRIANAKKPDTNFLEQDMVHLSAEPSERREKKKIVRRRSGDSEESNESRRSIKASKAPHIAIDLKPQPRAPLGLYDSVQITPKQRPTEPKHTRQGYTYVRLNRSATLRKATAQPAPEPCNQACSQKIAYLQEEVKMRNQQMEILEDERIKLRKDIQVCEGKVKVLQEANKALQDDVEKHRQENRRLGVQKKKLQSQRQSLVKKISFLEKINFSTETINIQSYRQQHLERQLQTCRDRLTRQKSEVERMLETELQRTKQDLFSTKKTVQALQISNSCLQRKLDEKVMFEASNDEYTTLRTRYRKFLVEFKDLRRQHERLQQEHAQLKSQLVLKTDEDLSLDLSTL